VTTGANELLKPIHDRMPVITPADKYNLWLDAGVPDHAALQDVLIPYPSGEMELFPVTPWMNSVAHDSPENIRPM
jgi:putative SOS response-associated peptidase YedK